MIKEMFSINSWIQEFERPLLFWVFLSFVCLYYYIKSKKTTRNFILLALISFYLIMFSGAPTVLFSILGGYNEMYRLYWLIPFVPLCACVMAEISNKNGRNAIVIVLLFITLIIQAGNWQLIKYERKQSFNNIYGVSDEAISCVNIVKSDIAFKGSALIATEESLTNMMKLYDCNMKMAIGQVEYWWYFDGGANLNAVTNYDTYYTSFCIMEEIYNPNNTISEEEFKKAVAKKNVDYIIINKNQIKYENLTSFRFVAETDNYNIFCCNNY